MNQKIKAAADKFWNNRLFDMKNPQLSFITGATWFKMNSGADEMAEALKSITDDPQFDMFCLKCKRMGNAALAKYNSFIKKEEYGK